MKHLKEVRNDDLQVCIVQENNPGPTFVRLHAKHLPAKVTVVHGLLPRLGDQCLLSQSISARAARKLWRTITHREWDWEITHGYLKVFRACQPDVVLAEFGPCAVRVLDACSRLRLPLIAHFHGGFDVGCYDVIRQHAVTYPRLFRNAAAVIAVSQTMRDDLIQLGAPPEKVHYVLYGVDPNEFSGADPAKAPPLFIAVGQFIDFKAPHLTLLAFAKVLRDCPTARLRMIGDGPLLPMCRDLAKALRITHGVAFLGKQPHDVVQRELRAARCFVQHSIIADSGNREGTPVAILEACMTGLPIVSTRHQGIAEVVRNGETGYLVDEYDIDSMSTRMVTLAKNSLLAAQLGNAARRYAVVHFNHEKAIERLWSIMLSTITGLNSGGK